MRKKKRTDIQHKILCAVLLTLVTASAGAQTAPKRPQMVVGIMVEGLSQDYLDLLHNHFTDGGFKRLMRDGATLSNVDYGGSGCRRRHSNNLYGSGSQRQRHSGGIRI